MTTSQTTALATTIPARAGGPLDVSYRLHTSQRVSTDSRVRPVFVFVHGIGMSHRYFARLQAHLIPYGDTVVFDLPGFGGTPTPSQQLSVSDYAHVIADALKNAQLSGCVVIGHSMGAQFVTELAAQHPKLVSAIVLIGPVTDTAHPSATRNSLVLAFNTLLERPVTNLLVTAAYLKCGIRWYLAELPVMLTYRLDDKVASLTQPVLIIRGSLDPIANRAWCQKLARRASDGRATEIPGQPHAAHRTGAPLVANAILNLVKDIPSAHLQSNRTWIPSSAEDTKTSLRPALPAPARAKNPVTKPDWRSITVGDRQCRAYLLEHHSVIHEVAGTVPTARTVFVLIHGIGMSHRYFLRLGRYLSRQGRVLVIDLPGYGWTHRPADEVTNPANAELVAALMDDIGVSSCTIVGHSMGVQTATELAIQRPDLVSHLVLIGAAVDERRRTIAQQALTLGLNSFLEEPLLNAVQFLDVLRCGPRWYLAELGIAMAYRLEERLPRATQPVLILRGSRDLVAGIAWSRSLADSSSDSTLTVVAGAPHAVHHSAPGTVAHHIIGFVTHSNDCLPEHAANTPRFIGSP
ncbi:pimeloyl-ACP methyl ester carboxylesterase [Arthrobacter sp. CAN_A212]|uniref:alpha/beta fold hydrolase n=1 Tax=unclassified Arthrobacter TaxID=235627 RepID=UPI0018CAAB7C|nr:alpha/beta hydrolase [Arthrobacter sp. CAN_C5]MBP2216677.1 pimeloyl-ACP methyl ester carboxylesterase [Arthrobacter sp. CAN_C5]